MQLTIVGERLLADFSQLKWDSEGDPKSNGVLNIIRSAAGRRRGKLEEEEDWNSVYYPPCPFSNIRVKPSVIYNKV